MPLHVPPFGGKDAVHHAVTNSPVPPGLVMADHAVLLGAESRDALWEGKLKLSVRNPTTWATMSWYRVLPTIAPVANSRTAHSSMLPAR